MEQTDKGIIQQVLDGDVRAFGNLVDRHKAKTMALAMRILKNREDAEEALQDAFVRMYRALPSFEWKSSFSTWLYRIVYNTCMTTAGKRNGIHYLSLNAQEETGFYADIEMYELQPDVKIESDEFEEIVREEIEKLPSAYGSTFSLFAIQEMSYEEIAQVVGIPIGTVKARIFRARLLLRNSIAERLGAQVTMDKIKKEI